MGDRAVGWVLEECDLPVVDRMVLTVYAYHASDEGAGIAPSLSLLTKLSGASRSTVQGARRRLAQAGYLLCREPVYRETAPVPADGTPYRLAMGNTLPSGGTLGGVRGGSLPTGQVTVEAPKQQRWSKEVDELFTYWKDVFSLNGRTKLTDGRRRCLRARLSDGYTVERIKRAIEGCAGSEFHTENGHTDLTLICRNGEKVEQFESKPRKEAASERKRSFNRILNPS